MNEEKIIEIEKAISRDSYNILKKRNSMSRPNQNLISIFI